MKTSDLKYDIAKANYDGLRRTLALNSLNMRAIKLRPEEPFEWASGYRMPIYNDNRLHLQSSTYRGVIQDLFAYMIKEIGGINSVEVIAGTSTAGIPHGMLLAHTSGKQFIYVRDKPKDHGLKNLIEGIADDEDLKGKKVLLIEDLISTGGSSVKAVQAIRDANGSIDHCFSIFNYGLDVAQNMFDGKIAYDKEGLNKLATPCKVNSALTYDILLQVAKDTGYLNVAQVKMLEEWRTDPFGWGEKHGFPRVVKK